MLIPGTQNNVCPNVNSLQHSTAGIDWKYCH